MSIEITYKEKEYKYKMEITLINGQTVSGYLLSTFGMDKVFNYMQHYFMPPIDGIREIIPLDAKMDEKNGVNSRIGFNTKNVLAYKYTLVE